MSLLNSSNSAKGSDAKAQHHPNDGVKSTTNSEDESYKEVLSLSVILLSLSTMVLSSVVLVSALVRIGFGVFSATICSIRFHVDDDEIAWLASSSITIGISRLILALPIARPVVDKRVYASATEDSRINRLGRTLSFAREVGASTHDVSLVCKPQLCAGMIHPSFYTRSVLIAWQEGLICMTGALLTIILLIQTEKVFSPAYFEKLMKLDHDLRHLFEPFGQNVSYQESMKVLRIVMKSNNDEDILHQLKGLRMAYKFGRHDCHLFSYMFATLFYYEDMVVVAMTFATLFLPFLFRYVDNKSFSSDAIR